MLRRGSDDECNEIVDAHCYFEIHQKNDNSTTVLAVPDEFRQASRDLFNVCARGTEGRPGGLGGVVRGLGRCLSDCTYAFKMSQF